MGNDIYTLNREEGMSWAAPYIAGLAALALQCNPNISPDKMRELMIDTVTVTSAGPVLNPMAFIERIRKTIQ